jgi:tryptophanyl-tRNA synthetase
LQNLINIYSLLSNKKTEEIEQKYQGKGYGDFKNELAEVIIEFLEPFQQNVDS